MISYTPGYYQEKMTIGPHGHDYSYIDDLLVSIMSKQSHFQYHISKKSESDRDAVISAHTRTSVSTFNSC